MNGLIESVINVIGKVKTTVTFASTPLYRDLPIYITSFTFAFYSLLSLGLSQLPLRFGNEVMFDKYMKTKHTLIVMGCSYEIYWIGTFLVNWMVMIFGNSVTVAAIGYFIPIFTKHYMSIVAVMISMASYSAAMLVYGYFWTFVFTSSRSYNMYVQLSTVALSLTPAYAISIFYDRSDTNLGDIPLRHIAVIMHRVCCFLLAPYVPIGSLMSAVMVMQQAENDKREARLSEFLSFENHLNYAIFGGIFQTIVYGIIILQWDSRSYKSKKPHKSVTDALKSWKDIRSQVRTQILSKPGALEAMVPIQFQSFKDSDVRYEEDRIDDVMSVFHSQKEAKKNGMEIPRHFTTLKTKAPQELPLIVVHNLHHLYMPTSAAGEPTVAVKGLSVGVSGGEVFGLLGPNGAGKSTTINLLTCDSHLEAPTEGDGFLGGFSVSREPEKAFPHIGLVPQFDALWPDVSVNDNLYTFAKIKNLPRRERQRVSSSLLIKLGLIPHQYKRIKELSGGNKRRTSVAVAFIGNPPVILMDEPSSGIDPGGRRKLLKMIQDEGKNRAIIITTHSMEEAESLCTKVGIVVNGEMQCLNTSLAIKNTYGAGMRLEVELAADWKGTGRMGKAEKEKTVQFVKSRLSEGAVLTEEVASRLFFTLPLRTDSLGRLFTVLASEADANGIKEYALSQPTLDYVFTVFAKRQVTQAQQ